MKVISTTGSTNDIELSIGLDLFVSNLFFYGTSKLSKVTATEVLLRSNDRKLHIKYQVRTNQDMNL
jgi:hypothetical protein